MRPDVARRWRAQGPRLPARDVWRVPAEHASAIMISWRAGRGRRSTESSGLSRSVSGPTCCAVVARLPTGCCTTSGSATCVEPCGTSFAGRSRLKQIAIPSRCCASSTPTSSPLVDASTSWRKVSSPGPSAFLVGRPSFGGIAEPACFGRFSTRSVVYRPKFVARRLTTPAAPPTAKPGCPPWSDHAGQPDLAVEGAGPGQRRAAWRSTTSAASAARSRSMMSQS